MPDDVVKFAFVIEGQGEIEAIPLLVRRICNDILGFFALKTTRPVRIPRSKLVRPGELERAIRLAQEICEGTGPVVVELDADEDTPCVLGPQLKARALKIARPQSVSIVIPKYEFEAWFLAAAESLRGIRGLRDDILPPPNPEAIRGAKEWLSRNMAPGRKYSASVDQVALVATMNLVAARTCRSFDRLCREIERLVLSC
jgi:hypothetical protein